MTLNIFIVCKRGVKKDTEDLGGDLMVIRGGSWPKLVAIDRDCALLS